MNEAIRNPWPAMREQGPAAGVLSQRGVLGAPASWSARGLPPPSPAHGETGCTTRRRPKAAAPLRFAAALQNLADYGRALAFLIPAGALGLLTAPLSAQSLGGGQFTLNGGPVTGGGGQSDGGAFAVAGGAGETTAALLTGGDFTVTGGLIGVAVVPGDFALTIGFTNDGQVMLEWPAEAANYVLESSPMVGEFADWQPVTPAPAGNTFTTPFDQPLRFFRLHKP